VVVVLLGLAAIQGLQASRDPPATGEGALVTVSRGHIEVNVGGHGRGASGCGGTLARSVDALSASGAGSGDGDIDMDEVNDEDNDYDDNTDDDDANDDNADDDDNDDETSGDAGALLEDENSHWVHLLAGMVRTNQDYGLGHMEGLPDDSADAPALFEAVELQTPTFFASCSLV
jgi:hypothetical protein